MSSPQRWWCYGEGTRHDSLRLVREGAFPFPAPGETCKRYKYKAPIYQTAGQFGQNGKLPFSLGLKNTMSWKHDSWPLFLA